VTAIQKLIYAGFAAAALLAAAMPMVTHAGAWAPFAEIRR
jgi:hypothetical protein